MEDVEVTVAGIQDVEGTGDIVVQTVEWDRCQFWIENRRRFCRMCKVGSELFCGDHIIKVTGSNWVNQKDGRKRIPCPYDGTHTCYEHLLNKHLKVCNARPKPIPAFIKENLNRTDLTLNRDDSPETNNNNNKELKRLESLSDEEYGFLIRNLVEFRQKYCPDIQRNYGFHPLMGSELVRSDIGETAMKHLSQVASLLKIMDAENMLRDNTCFIEYGSGTGALTFQIATIVAELKLQNCIFILIDKSSPRHKKDNKLTDSGMIIHRIRADIKDVAVGQLPGVSDENTHRIIGVAKHLCGSATDMALRSLFDSNLNTAFDKVVGCCFATCCHHRCESSVYPGWKFLNKVFSTDWFPALTQISSWATNGDGQSRLDDNRFVDLEHLRFFQKLSDSILPNVFLREQIGEFVKEILEKGRIEYINSLENGKFHPGVAFYIEKWTTLENRVIFASTDSPTAKDRFACEQKIFENRQKVVGAPKEI